MAAVSRTALRLYRFRKLALDDFFLILARLFLSTGYATIQLNRYLLYMQMQVTLVAMVPPNDFNEELLRFQTLNTTSSLLTFGAIFSVKLAFVMFFRDLISRVRYLKTWWWIVLGTLVSTGLFCMFFAFDICANFTLDMQGKSPIDPFLVEGSTCD